MSAQPPTQYFHHGRFRVAGVLPDAITAYRTYGEPTNPCIVFPTCYGGKLDSGFISPKCFTVLLLKLLSFRNIIFRPIVHGKRWEGMSYMRLNRFSWLKFTGDESQEVFHCCFQMERYVLYPHRKLNRFFKKQLLNQSSSPSNTVSLYD